jgi:hypothetical protein
MPFTQEEIKRVVMEASKEKALAQMGSLVAFSLNAGTLSRMT